MFSQCQRSLSSPGRASFRPSAVNFGEEAREGKCLELHASLCPGRASSGPEAGQPDFQGCKTGKRHPGGQQSQKPLKSAWRQPARVDELLSAPCDM